MAKRIATFDIPHASPLVASYLLNVYRCMEIIRLAASGVRRSVVYLLHCGRLSPKLRCPALPPLHPTHRRRRSLPAVSCRFRSTWSSPVPLRLPPPRRPYVQLCVRRRFRSRYRRSRRLASRAPSPPAPAKAEVDRRSEKPTIQRTGP